MPWATATSGHRDVAKYNLELLGVEPKAVPMNMRDNVSVTRPKLLHEGSRRNQIPCLEALRESAEDRVEKFERSVSLSPISPQSCEAHAGTQLKGQQTALARKLQGLQQAWLAPV